MKRHLVVLGVLLLSCVDDAGGTTDQATTESGTDAGECLVGGQGCECTAGGSCDGDLMCIEGVCQASECPVGAEGCACTSGGSCDAGLVCVADTCTPDSGDGDGDGDPTGDGDGDGDPTGDGDGDGDGDPGVCGDGVVEGVEQCDDGNAMADDGCTDCVIDPRLVFVTSTVHTGAIGSLAAADEICNARAAAANLSGTYVAWLSTDLTTAASRFVAGVPDGPYLRVDGVTIVDDLADLQDGSIDAPINVDENGLAVQGTCWVWTNTNPMAQPYGDIDCVNWTSSDIIPGGRMGNCQAIDTTWTSQQDVVQERCNNARRLYCFQDGF